MLKFNLSLKGLDKGQKLTEEQARRILMKCMFKMEELAIKNAPVNQGTLRMQISIFPQILSNKYILTSWAKYSEAMEYGTRPYWAPIAPLKEWAEQKLGDENIGYAVQAKIAKYGIRAHPYMRPSLIEVQQYWLQKYINEEFKSR